MAYKLSDRRGRNGHRDEQPDGIDFGQLATVFIVFGLLSLLTAAVFSTQTETTTNTQFRPGSASLYKPATAGPVPKTDNGLVPYRPNDKAAPSKPADKIAAVGPITVRKYNESYRVNVKANMPVQSWSFIEGQVVNHNKEYLFSFGKELWHESGRDADGYWREADNEYSVNITFPKPGTYYLHFVTQTNKLPKNIKVTVEKRLGSSLPHLWFGIIVLIIGIVLNEMKNRTVKRILDKIG